jgi:thiamine-monophosphate kinase
VTALGSLDGRDPVRRSGARTGDVVAIAGDLGVAALGLDVLFSRFTDSDGSPVPVEEDRFAELTALEATGVLRQLAPRPPVAMGALAAAHGATAMMDVSDGLALDARRLADASGVTIDLETGPLGSDPDRALSGGEDHALLATFPKGVALPPGFRRLGSVRERSAAAVTVDGVPYDGDAGWDPYRDWDSGRG